jgi:hypothetical protein
MKQIRLNRRSNPSGSSLDLRGNEAGRSEVNSVDKWGKCHQD